MNHYQYLVVMAACLAATAPLELLGARVYRQAARLARAVLPVAVVFGIWDALAIAGHVWAYNPRYITGIRLPFGIPVEELVFFLVIPVCGILAYGGVQAVARHWQARNRWQARGLWQAQGLWQARGLWQAVRGRRS